MKRKALPVVVGLVVAVGAGGFVMRGAGSAERPPVAAGAVPARERVAASGAEAAGRVPLDVYLRRWQGIPPDVRIEVGPPSPGPAAGLETLTITLTRDARAQRADVYRTGDGRYLLPGPLLDLTEDPHAALAARLDLEGRASLGRAKARLTVVEYSSFQCPFCRQLAPVVKATMRGRLGSEIRWVYKHFPLATQAWSEPAAVAAECARRTGGDAKFWALHDLYFEQQPSFTPENHRERVVAWARRAGLSPGRFEACLDGPEAPARVREDAAEGRSIGVSVTPTLVINGRVAPGLVSREALEEILEQELAYQRALAAARAGDRQ